MTTTGLPPLQADGRAPIGVMGEHRHKRGEAMLSYRFMHMDMEMRDNQIATNKASNDTIAATIPDNSGGHTVMLYGGFDLMGQRGGLRGPA